MAKPKSAGRARRREQERAAHKLARARERLFRLEPGGSPERPLEVETAALVEPRALAVECPRCSGPMALEAHDALRLGERRLRRAALRCRRCGAPASLYFRLVPPAIN